MPTASVVPPPAPGVDQGAAATTDPHRPSNGWIRRMSAACWAHRGLTVAAALSAVGGIGIGAIGPVLTKLVIDGAIAGSSSALPWLIGSLIALAIIRYASSFVRRYAGGKLSLAVQHDLRQHVFTSMQTFDGAMQDTLRTGQIVSRANTDLGLVQGLLAFLPLTIGQAVLFGVSLVIMVILSPLLSLVVVAVIPLVAYVTQLTRKRLFPATWAAQQSAAEVADIVEEDITGVRVVKGFGQEDRETARLEGVAARLYGERMRAIRLTARLSPALPMITTLGQVAILALGGYLALNGSITLGTFIAFNAYLAQIIGPVRTISLLLVMAQQARAGVERVFEVIDSRASVVDPAHPRPLPPGPLSVDFNDLHFGYLSGEPVLSGFDLHLRAGETIAMVGTSGSGKSTVSLLLPRFYDPAWGAVRIGGTDVRELRLTDLRAALGVVFEEAFLFSDTVLANIAYGRADATLEQVRGAAMAAEADEFIAQLPQGYDTVIGERGLTLSGGQRQRLALARALLTDPRVLILDDATSAVDPTTEAAILATMRAVTADRTTLLIAHRRSTLALADRIAVIDAGRVLDVGTEDELRRRSPAFNALIGQLTAAQPAPETAFDRAPEPDTVTPDLWPSDTAPAGAADNRRGSERAERAPMARGGGAAHGGGAGMGGFMAGLPSSPELLAQVQALPAPNDTPGPESDNHRHSPFSILRMLRGVRGLLIAALILVALDALAGLALPVLIRRGIDSGVVAGALPVLWWTSMFAVVVAVVTFLIEREQSIAAGKAGETLLYQLRVRSFAHLQRLGLDYYEGQLTGRILTRMTTDIDAQSAFLQTGLTSSVVSLVTFAGILVVLLVMDLSLALLAFTALPIIIVATVWFRRISSRAYADAREKVSIVNADLAENVAGLRVAQSLGRSATNTDTFAARSADYRNSRMKAQTAISIYFPGVAFLSELAAAVVLGVGAGQVAAGTLTVGTLVAFVLYLDSFFAPIQQLSQAFDGYQQARVGLTRIGELLATVPGTPAAAHPLPVGRLAGRVRADAAEFRYSTAEMPAIDGVALSIEPGQTVAVVGPTGAGKSTLVKLIARFYDVTGGAILVDGIDVRDFDLTAYRRRLGVVPQESYLFAGSVRDNIAYGRPSASDAEVEAAARAVGAVSAIARLPGRFRHPISDRGRNLAAGQRQLIALARAELVEPDLLLLDEATVALDHAAEAAVLDASDRLARGRTTVVVAHRLTTAARADVVVVMERGRVVQIGRHQDLLRVDGPYARLYRSSAESATQINYFVEKDELGVTSKSRRG